MNFSGDRFAIIIGSGNTDAYLVGQLLQYFPDALIVRFHLRKLTNYRYYLKKLFRIGVINSLHIKMLAAFLIAKRLLTRGAPAENYKIHHPVQDCYDQDTMEALCKDKPYVLVTQALRLKDHFLRHHNVLQISPGRYPDYCGDAALFWAWAQRRQQDYRYSLILRHRYFIHSVPVHCCPVQAGERETIYSLRMKGMRAMAADLPKVLPQPATWQKRSQHHNPKFLNAPTFVTYILVTRFHAILKRLPPYATK